MDTTRDSTATAEANLPATHSPFPVLLNVPGGSPDPDANLHLAAKDNVPIRIRVQPTVLVGLVHRPLSSIRWILDFPSVESVQEFYRDLDEYVREWVRVKGESK